MNLLTRSNRLSYYPIGCKLLFGFSVKRRVCYKLCVSLTKLGDKYDTGHLKREYEYSWGYSAVQNNMYYFCNVKMKIQDSISININFFVKIATGVRCIFRLKRTACMNI